MNPTTHFLLSRLHCGLGDIIPTIVGKIEARNSKIITDSLELLDSQIRRLLEESFKEAENQVRILVADLAEGMWAQQRRVIGIQQRIRQYRGEKETRRKQCVIRTRETSQAKAKSDF